MTSHSDDSLWFSKRYETLKSEGKSGWVSDDDWGFHLRWLDAALSASYTPMTGSALELGCGAGNWCKELTKRGFSVTGVDFSETAIEWARKQAGDSGQAIRYIVGDVTDSHLLTDEKFAFVLDGFCYHCLPFPADRAKYLANVKRLLSPDGVFYLRAFCSEDPHRGHWSQRMDPTTRIVIEDGRSSKYVGSAEAIKAQVESAQLQIIHAEASDFVDGMLQLHAVVS